MNGIEKAYLEKCQQPSDINEHLPTIRRLSEECLHITEMGVRSCVSTWAFLMGLQRRGGTLVSIDIKHPKEYGGNLQEVENLCLKDGIKFTFILGDTLNIIIQETDLLFIDTLHVAAQLKSELEKHSSMAKKYIVLHDTISCAAELDGVIREFLEGNPSWQMKQHYENNNGLMVLKNVSNRTI